MSVLLDVRFDTVGPFLTAGEGASTPGIDVPRARDAAGNPVIPGSHVAGRLRDALVRLMLGVAPHPPIGAPGDSTELEHQRWQDAEAAVSRLFGSRTQDTRDAGLASSAVAVTPFRLGKASAPVSPLRRIGVDRRRRCADDAAMVFMDTAAIGTRESWSGRIAVDPVPGLALPQISLLLWAGLKEMGTLGGNVSAGFGRVNDVRVTATGKPDSTVGTSSAQELRAAFQALRTAPPGGPARVALAPAGGQALGGTSWADRLLTLVIDSPLVVGDHDSLDNLFESRDDLPGSVVKRFLADLLLRKLGRPASDRWVGAIDPETVADPGLKELVRWFDSLSCGFALPVSDEAEVRRPWACPLSSWARRDSTSLVDGDELREGLPPPAESSPPVSARRHAFDQPATWIPGGEGSGWHPRHVLLTRTSVDPLRRTAGEGLLFSYRAVAEGQTFQAWIRCPQPALAGLESLLQGVSSRDPDLGIPALGKGTRRGFGEVRSLTLAGKPGSKNTLQRRVSAFWAALDASADGLPVPLVLNTDALLLDPEGLTVATPPDELEARYGAAWRAALRRLPSGAALGSVTVERMWVRHRLRGVRSASGDLDAPPSLLTCPGSSFLLRLKGLDKPAALALLEELAAQGAENPSVLAAVEAAQARPGQPVFCPWRASNGYGEVVVAHPVHLPPAGHPGGTNGGIA